MEPFNGAKDFLNVLYTKIFYLFYELFAERFFGESKMVLLWHHYENLFWNFDF